MELKRHFVTLSPEETDEVVGLVAGMIVRFLQAKGEARKAGTENGTPEPTEHAAAEVRS